MSSRSATSCISSGTIIVISTTPTSSTTSTSTISTTSMLGRDAKGGMVCIRKDASSSSSMFTVVLLALLALPEKITVLHIDGMGCSTDISARCWR
jgi:hypothetical protein